MTLKIALKFFPFEFSFDFFVYHRKTSKEIIQELTELSLDEIHLYEHRTTKVKGLESNGKNSKKNCMF